MPGASRPQSRAGGPPACTQKESESDQRARAQPRRREWPGVQLPAAVTVPEPPQRQGKGKVARNSGEQGSQSGSCRSFAELHHSATDWPSEKSEGSFWRRATTNGVAAAPGGERLRSSPAAGQLHASRAPPRLRPGTASKTALLPGPAPLPGPQLHEGALRAARQAP